MFFRGLAFISNGSVDEQLFYFGLELSDLVVELAFDAVDFERLSGEVLRILIVLKIFGCSLRQDKYGLLELPVGFN